MLTTERILTQQAAADLAQVPARSRWITAGEIRLHVLDYGEGSEHVPLLIVPGITTSAIGMDFVARELTDLVRPIVVDVRGRGFSDDGPEYRLPDYVTDTEAVIAGLELDRPILLGHSMGARIAGLTAANKEVPLRGTVLVDPPMSGPDRGPYPTTVDTFRDQLAQAQRGTTADEVARSWPRWPERELQLRARWLASCAEKALVDTHRGFETEDFFDFWPDVPAPTVLIYGADSPVVTAAGAGEAASANPEARLVRVSGAGHMVFWDNPAAALDTVRDELRALVGELDHGRNTRTAP